MTNILLALTTCPDAATAERLAMELVTAGLAACVQRLPEMHSTYKWQGKVQTEGEILLLIKTTETCFPALEVLLKQLHPYEVPELIAVPVCAGSPPYLNWVRQNTGPAP